MSATPAWGMLILIVLVGLVVLGVVGVAVWLSVRRPRGGADPSLMACGACGYSVRGVKTTSCPECGADLREVGIVRPQTSGARAWWAVPIAVILIFLVALFVCLGGVMISTRAPRLAPRPVPTQQSGGAAIEQGAPADAPQGDAPAQRQSNSGEASP